MRVASLVASHDLRVLDVDPPELEPDGVLVETRFAGICGSDVHIFEGVHPGVPLPMVLGHEATGVVVESATGSPARGTPVAVVPLFWCGQCTHCRVGEPYICLRREVMGFHRPGCLSELLSLPRTHVLPLEPGQDPALAALFEPLAVAIHGAARAEPRPGEYAVIFGAGNVGLLLAHFLRDELGVRVSLVDINPARVSFARSLDFDAATQAAELDLARLDARPLAFECVGSAASASAILDIMPAPRVAVLVGTFPREASVDLLRLKRYETRVVGSQIYTLDELRQALAILASPAGESYRKLVVPGQFELAGVGAAIEAARTTTQGTKVIVKVSP